MQSCPLEGDALLQLQREQLDLRQLPSLASPADVFEHARQHLDLYRPWEAGEQLGGHGNALD